MKERRGYTGGVITRGTREPRERREGRGHQREGRVYRRRGRGHREVPVWREAAAAAGPPR